MFAKEYAKALYELALSSNAIDEINENFKTLLDGILENEDYIKVLTYPRISNIKKKKSISDVCKSMNKTFIDFLYVLIDNNRIGNIKEIYDEYENIIEQNNNIIYADVTTASKLNKSQLGLLANNLSKYFSNKKVVINEVIDETLIGGVKVVADGKLIDLSLTNRLESLMNQI